jgi:hypothetical protein
MAEPDLEAGLRTLRKSLRQIKALLAWQQLKQSEARPGQPLAFQINDPIETDLRNEYSFFLSTSVQMHNILNDESVPISLPKRQHLKQELAKIEGQVYGLSLPKRLY